MKGTKPAVIIAGSSAVNTIPRPPAWLGKSARAEWKRLAPIMICQRGILSIDEDLNIFAACCSAAGEMIDHAKTVEKEGATYRTTNGLIKKHPAVGMMADAMNRFARLAAELGMTPISRSRPAMRDKDPANEDDTADLGL